MNACAGSGKTSTLIAYSKERPDASILYVAYNKSVKEEARHKFGKNGVKNVHVETAHSLAYGEVVHAGGYTVNQTGNLRPHEVMEFCRIKEDHGHGVVLANHVLGCLSQFCNSDKERIHEVDYTGGEDASSRIFVARHLDQIHGYAKRLLNEMYDGNIDITHDVYLKLYQLRHPILPYTHILFDEGQDANPCMLDVFRSQKANKIIVGDTYQSIYSFNGAVNSLELLDYPLYRLTKSFRFGKNV